LKTHPHFEVRIRERYILREWCERVRRSPVEVQVQEDGRIRMWAFIEERGKFLRIVLLDDRETFYTATWDRRFKVRR
jgi:hypothetical protein